jgi:hypothetical protein
MNDVKRRERLGVRRSPSACRLLCVASGGLPQHSQVAPALDCHDSVVASDALFRWVSMLAYAEPTKSRTEPVYAGHRSQTNESNKQACAGLYYGRCSWASTTLLFIACPCRSAAISARYTRLKTAGVEWQTARCDRVVY